MFNVNKSQQHQEIEVTNIFGSYTINTANSVHFQNGLIGLSQLKNFIISACSHASLNGFLLMHSVEDSEVVFLLMPVASPLSIYREGDVKQAMTDLAGDDGQFFLIVTMHHEESFIRLTANAKAPIIMDLNNRIAYQYVFNNEDYSLQMKI